MRGKPQHRSRVDGSFNFKAWIAVALSAAALGGVLFACSPQPTSQGAPPFDMTTNVAGRLVLPPFSVGEDWPTVNFGPASWVPVNVRIRDTSAKGFTDYTPACNLQTLRCVLLNLTPSVFTLTIALPADGLLPLFVRTPLPGNPVLHLFCDAQSKICALIDHAHPKRRR